MTNTTGLKSLDRILVAPLKAGTVTLYCGYSASGMTTLLDTAAVANALDNKNSTLLCDAETSRRAHADRIMSAYSGVPLTDIKRGDLTGIQAARIAAAKASSSGRPLMMSDAKSIDGLHEDITSCRAGIVLIDGFRYLGYVAGYDPDHDVTLLARLKRLAQDRNVAVVATSPLSRPPATERRPSLAAVKEGLASLADAVVLLNREDLNDPDTDGRSAVVELAVVKNRFGGVSACEAAAQYTHARFIDIPQSGSRAA
jgi:replicative DNA helicase